ncbi:MAG: cadherin repeat domain-containing protein [Candidatus Thiodiazotropha weberae]|nr:cadherin repeat domain-containing protein [Candidatus Thiodiazotropha weberae]
MAAPTGVDFLKDYRGAADQNPLVDSDLTMLDAAMQIIGERLNTTSTDYSYQFARYNTGGSATTIEIAIELREPSTYNSTGAGLIDASGNGYAMRCRSNGTSIYLDRVTGGDHAADLGSSDGVITFTNGDNFRLRKNLLTDDLTVLHNGTPIITANDTTYDTNLHPAVLFQKDSGSNAGIGSWGGVIGATASRSADSIDTFQRGATGSIISCTGLDAAPTTQTVTVTDGTHSDTCSINTWSATAINIDVDCVLPPGTYDIQVTDDTGTVTLADQTLLIESNRDHVVYDGTPTPAGQESLGNEWFADHGVTAVTDDQYGIVQHAAVTWNSAGQAVIDPLQTVSVAYWAWDDSTGTMYTGTLTIAEEATLTNQTLTSTGQNTQQVQVDTDVDTGTIHAYWSESATPPSAADLEAGTGAVYKTSQPVTSAGTKTINGTGLVAGTTYYCHLLHNNSGARSDIVTTAGVATDAAPADTTPDAIVWTDVTDASINTLYQDVQQVTGVDAGETLTAVGCEVSNDNQATWHASVTMVTGQTYARAQVTTGTSYSTPYDQVATVNGVGDVFTATTMAQPNRQPVIGPQTFYVPLSLGPELVTNGSFDTDLTGWTGAVGYWSVVSGRAHHADSSTFYPLTQSPGFSVDTIYQIDADVDVASGSANISLFNSAGGGLVQTVEQDITTADSFSNYVIPLPTATHLGFARTFGQNFDGYVDNVSVRAVTTVSIGTVVASDPDLDTLTYAIIAGNTDSDIAIDSNTGELSWANAPDPNRTPTYNLTVQVSDGELTASAAVTVTVLAVSSGGDSEDGFICSIIKSLIQPLVKDVIN